MDSNWLLMQIPQPLKKFQGCNAFGWLQPRHFEKKILFQLRQPPGWKAGSLALHHTYST